MLFTRFAPFLLPASLALGAAIEPFDKFESGPIEKRAVGGIYICTDPNWGGQCGYKVQPIGVCISLTAPWLYAISSFGPDKGTWVEFYSDTQCKQFTYKGFTYPGTGNLDGFGQNDKIGSFIARSSPPLNSPPGGGGGGGPSDPNRLLSCNHQRTFDSNAQCNTNTYCAYTYNNNNCAFSGGDSGVPNFKECIADLYCSGSSKCVNGLCCNADSIGGTGNCPTKENIDACCFQKYTEYKPGTGAKTSWYMQSSLPSELKCGCS